jgi:hypothetical protein
VDPTVGISSPVTTVYVFALFKILQGDGTARRMLLQQAAPNTRSSDGAASAAVHLGMTPATLAAYVLDISPELVTSWNLQLQTSEADACLPVGKLMENARDRLLVLVSSAATALRDVQVVSLDVYKAGVSCSASRPPRRRQLLSSVVSGPFITVEALFIFDDAAAVKPSLDLAQLQDAPGVLSALQIQSPSAVSTVNIVGAPASLEASTDIPSSSSSSSSSPLYLVLAAAAGAALAVTAVVVVRRLSARGGGPEVQGVHVVTHALHPGSTPKDLEISRCDIVAPPADLGGVGMPRTNSGQSLSQMALLAESTGNMSPIVAVEPSTANTAASLWSPRPLETPASFAQA